MDLKWLTEQLERPGYSQAGLARALGKDAAAVNRMLKGTRLIKANELPIIAQYLNSTPPGTDEHGYPLSIRAVQQGGDRADAERDLAAAGTKATARELRETLDWLLEAARPLRDRELGGKASSAQRP